MLQDSSSLNGRSSCSRQITWLHCLQNTRVLKTLSILVLAVILGILICFLPIKRYTLNTMQWIQIHPFLGSFVYLVSFWIAIPLCIPATLFETIGGTLFGFIHGGQMILIGKTGGSLLAFLMGRSLGKEMIGGYLKKNFPAFRAVLEVLKTSGWKPLILIQLSSLPNIVKCYGLAITDTSARDFCVSSMLGGLPHAIIWSYIGSQAKDFVSGEGGPEKLTHARLITLLIGAVFTIGTMSFMVWYTKKQLAQMQMEDQNRSGDEEEVENEDKPLISVHSMK